MTEYHPPMTGAEARFEEELDPKHRSPNSRAEKEMRTHEDRKPPQETKADRKVEEAMHLGQ